MVRDKLLLDLPRSVTKIRMLLNKMPDCAEG